MKSALVFLFLAISMITGCVTLRPRDCRDIIQEEHTNLTEKGYELVFRGAYKGSQIYGYRSADKQTFIAHVFHHPNDPTVPPKEYATVGECIAEETMYKHRIAVVDADSI